MIDFDGLLLGPTLQAFGEPVIYTIAGYAPLPITAVFFRSSMQLLPMGGSGGQEPYLLGAAGDLTTREPILGVQMSQFFLAQPAPDTARLPNLGISQPAYGIYPTPPSSASDDTLVVTGVPGGRIKLPAPAQGDTAYVVSVGLLYQVKEVLPDGVGHAKLTLTLIGNT